MNYTWKLTGLKKVNGTDLSDIICQTYWEVIGETDDGLVGIFNGATPIDPESVDPENFTEYRNLTEEQVLGWVQAIVTDEQTGYWPRIQENINRAIAQRSISENIEGENLPWNIVEEEETNNGQSD